MNETGNPADFYDRLVVPEACLLGKRLFKKQFYEHAKLATADKHAFADDIDRIDWSYTLKPSTINIPKLEDDKHEYLEVAILQVMLSSISRHARIAAVIQRAIPYPLLIVFVRGESIAINAADKRIHRADANKIVVEATYDTGWIDASAPNAEQNAFLSDFCVANFSFRNLYEFYQDMVVRIIALNCAAHSGRYKSPSEMAKPKADRLSSLRKIEELHQERADLRGKLKGEKNLGTQVNLNTRNKQISDSIKAIRKSI